LLRRLDEKAILDLHGVTLRSLLHCTSFGSSSNRFTINYICIKIRPGTITRK
jgi:hypothetical protein